MKKTAIKIISVMLLAVLCLSMFSCKKKEEAKDSTTVTTVPSEGGNSLEDYPNQVGIKNFDGKEFVIATINTNVDSFFTLHVSEKGMENYAVNDAMYLRDEEMMREYGIDVKYQLYKNGDDGAELAKNVSTAVLGNTYICDMVSSPLTSGIMTLSGVDALNNMLDIPTINMDNPWWSHYFKNNMTYNDTLYYSASQAAGGGYFATPYVMICNTSLLSELKDDQGNAYNIFDVINNGEWTLETFKTMIKDYTEDLNGDGTIKVTEDKLAYAHMTTPVTASCHFVAAGNVFSGFNSKGNIVVNLQNDKTVAAVEELANIFDSIKDNCDMHEFTKNPSEQVVAFTTDRALFFGNSMSYIETLSTMESDYAVIPCPKGDKEQKNYISGINTFTAGYVAVPKNAGGETFDMDFVGYAIEMLAYTSYMRVKPVVYDNILCARLAKDEKQVAVMDTIYKGLYLDINFIKNFGGTVAIVQECIFDKNVNITSRMKAVNSIIKNDIKAFEENS